MYKLSKNGLDFIKGYESFVPYLYDDFKWTKHNKYGYNEWTGGTLSGTLTIGYGHTKDAIGKYDMSVGSRITEEEAAKLLDIDLGEIKDWINNNVTVPLTQGQFDALASFGFNCGTGNLAKLVRPLNQGDYKGTRAKFDEFTRSKGKFMQGLQNRRDGEQNLWDATYQESVDRSAEPLPGAPTATPVPQSPPLPVDHPAEVDTPPVVISNFEKSAGAVATLAPIVTAVSADWRVALVIGGLVFLGFFGWLVWKKTNG